jgi:hypothetical protein
VRVQRDRDARSERVERVAEERGIAQDVQVEHDQRHPVRTCRLDRPRHRQPAAVPELDPSRVDDAPRDRQRARRACDPAVEVAQEQGADARACKVARVCHRIGGHDATRVARRESPTNDTAAFYEQLRDEPGQTTAIRR